MKNMKIRITLLDEMLGTAPNDKEIYGNFIASKSPDASTIEEEIASVGVDEVVEKSMTVFPRDENGKPFIWDYQIKGFFKDACGMLSKVAGKDEVTGKKKKAVNESGKMTAYKKNIDGLIFVEPRKISINFEGEIGSCQRPLRAQTAQGERVALANSETIPAGATMDIEIQLFSDDHEKAVLEWLDYGKFRGLGQWRNSGKGRFTYEVLEIS